MSGYGAQRPIAANDGFQGKSANRRIDVRIVMYQPYDYKSLNLLLKRLGVATVREVQDEMG